MTIHVNGVISASEIKTQYESNANTNEYDDAEQSKLGGCETGAKDDQTGAEIKTAYEAEANAYTDTKNTKLAGIDTNATKYPDTGEQVFTDSDHTKLNGIDTGAKDDQTKAEIESLVDGLTKAVVASDTLLHTNATERSNSIASYTKIKETLLDAITGVARIAFDGKSSGGWCFHKIYINGAAVGTERTTNSTSYTTWSEDIAVTAGDLIQIYSFHTDGSALYVRNLLIKGTLSAIDYVSQDP